MFLLLVCFLAVHSFICKHHKRFTIQNIQQIKYYTRWSSWKFFFTKIWVWGAYITVPINFDSFFPRTKNKLLNRHNSSSSWKLFQQHYTVWLIDDSNNYVYSPFICGLYFGSGFCLHILLNERVLKTFFEIEHFSSVIKIPFQRMI